MKMHLYGLHPSIWEVVVVVVTPPTNGVPTAEQAQDYFRNAQAMRVITSSLCAQEFNKLRNVEIAKKIWDTLREAHVGTDELREGKMDLLQQELEHFIMHDEETISWKHGMGDYKVTKKLLRAFTPRNPTLATMIRRNPKFKVKTPNQLLGEILHQELVERDVAMSFSHKVNKNVALNASSSDKVESSPKALKSRKEDSSDEGSTDEEMALVLINFKKFMKKKYYKKGGDDKKNPSQRRCYECNEWESSHEDSDHEGMTTLAIPKSSRKLFNNISNDEDDAPFYLMARGTKVQESSNSSSHSSTISSSTQNDFDDEEEQHEAFMIKEFGKKGFKEIKKFMEKLKKKEFEKLAINLSLANDSKERMSKEPTLMNESLASLKATHSELQESFSCLTIKYKGLEVSYNALWESTKTNSKATLDSNISTSEGCSSCYKIDVQACITSLAKLEKLIKAKDA
ncbi:hypothetical protein GQ55_3G316900 [Panicum hallii var. hallii]|uniref:UBN2 domain-containing protein n=1 Tax=Panicum hallii var. hallii TaxID=1504633 RepID=A0A2T7EFB8_9POAL|nr:hypothetical protein GQ55_3G316900 [Panicum hallii var. hallii]